MSICYECQKPGDYETFDNKIICHECSSHYDLCCECHELTHRRELKVFKTEENKTPNGNLYLSLPYCPKCFPKGKQPISIV